MKLEDLKLLYKQKGEFKFTFEWYLPVSIKFGIADLAKKKKVSETQLVEEALREKLKKEK